MDQYWTTKQGKPFLLTSLRVNSGWKERKGEKTVQRAIRTTKGGCYELTSDESSIGDSNSMMHLVFGLESSENGDGGLLKQGRRVRLSAKAMDEKSRLTTTVGSSTLTGWNLEEQRK